MTIDEEEGLALLEVLIAIANADGKLKADERKALTGALCSLQLPASVSVEALLGKAVDVDAALARITSAEAKEQLYRSAHFMANADSVAAPEEKALLAKVEAAVSPSDELRARVASLAPPPSSGAAAWLSSLRSLFGG